MRGRSSVVEVIAWHPILRKLSFDILRSASPRVPRALEALSGHADDRKARSADIVKGVFRDLLVS